MTFGRFEETLREAFHELLYRRDFEIDMESFIPYEPGGSRGRSEKSVLEDLHPMDEGRSSLCENGARISHYRADTGDIDKQLASEAQLATRVEHAVQSA